MSTYVSADTTYVRRPIGRRLTAANNRCCGAVTAINGKPPAVTDPLFWSHRRLAGDAILNSLRFLCLFSPPQRLAARLNHDGRKQS